jgi:dephospho-CoA kinase
MVLKDVPWNKGQALDELIDLCSMLDFSTRPPHLLPVVGLTGGIGSGKTTAAGIFNAVGIPVYNADQRAKTLYKRDEALRTWVVGRFGTACGAYKDQRLVDINRKALADIVFSDSGALAELNAAVHPAVLKDFNSWHATQSEHADAPYIIREAAILIETGGHKHCDLLVVVRAPRFLRMERAVRRLHADESQIEKRMHQQLSDEARAEHADFVLDNADENSLLRQVLEVHRRITSERTQQDLKTP